MGQPGIPEPPGFSELTKEEQIRYLEALWDRIADQPGELPVPESHLSLAAERLEEYRRQPDRAGAALDVVDRIRGRWVDGRGADGAARTSRSGRVAKKGTLIS